MIKTIYECDKCGLEEEAEQVTIDTDDPDKSWMRIFFDVVYVDAFPRREGFRGREQEMLLCSNCFRQLRKPLPRAVSRETMTPYPYNCPTCGPVTLKLPMDLDEESKLRQDCPHCGERMTRDYGEQFRSQIIRAPSDWMNHTRQDFLPRNVIGAGPHSKQHRDYAHKTQSLRGEY